MNIDLFSGNKLCADLNSGLAGLYIQIVTQPRDSKTKHRTEQNRTLRFSYHTIIPCLRLSPPSLLLPASLSSPATSHSQPVNRPPLITLSDPPRPSICARRITLSYPATTFVIAFWYIIRSAGHRFVHRLLAESTISRTSRMLSASVRLASEILCRVREKPRKMFFFFVLIQLFITRYMRPGRPWQRQAFQNNLFLPRTSPRMMVSLSILID